MMRRTTLPRVIYDYFLEHWILSALLITLAAHWFVLLRIVGKDIGALDAQGSLTVLGHWITWPVFAISLTFALLKTAADRYNQEAQRKGGFIYQRLLEGVNMVALRKMERFCEFVGQGTKNAKDAVFHQITKPRHQIASVLDNIEVVLAEIFGIERDFIGISVLCRNPGDREWRFLTSRNISTDLDANALLSNPGTTVRQVLDQKGATLFFPDKRVGVNENRYVPSSKDKQFGVVGSILCRNISVGSSLQYYDAILCISTYGKCLCKANDTDAIGKIVNIIIPAFEIRLRTELALLFAREVMESRCLKCQETPEQQDPVAVS